MKEMWLEYGPTGYVYWEGLENHKHHNRIGLKAEGLLMKLDDIIDSKRKSQLNLRNVPEEIREDFKQRYSGTKVKVVFVE